MESCELQAFHIWPAWSKDLAYVQRAQYRQQIVSQWIFDKNEKFQCLKSTKSESWKRDFCSFVKNPQFS